MRVAHDGIELNVEVEGPEDGPPVAFLHGVVPRFLASITDALAAIIVAVVGIVWAVLMAVGALIATVKSIRLEKERA